MLRRFIIRCCNYIQRKLTKNEHTDPNEALIARLVQSGAIIGENVLFCECKWTNCRFDIHDLSDLKKSSVCINRPHQYFMIFAKNGVTDEVSAAIGGNQSYFVVTMNELFK
jgi:hypothetical protein